jgi:GNAT superfamily N-acetyltransferase
MIKYTYSIQGKIGGYTYHVEFFKDNENIGYVDVSINLSNTNILQIGFLEIYRNFRGKGYGKQVYKALSELYHNEFSDKIIARKFINPIAEKLAKSALNNGLFPPHSWDERYIERKYAICN